MSEPRGNEEQTDETIDTAAMKDLVERLEQLVPSGVRRQEIASDRLYVALVELRRWIEGAHYWIEEVDSAIRSPGQEEGLE